MSIRVAIEKIRRDHHRAEIVYDDAKPLSVDIVVRCSSLGLDLRFEALSQRLRMIDIFDLHAVRVQG